MRNTHLFFCTPLPARRRGIGVVRELFKTLTPPPNSSQSDGLCLSASSQSVGLWWRGNKRIFTMTSVAEALRHVKSQPDDAPLNKALAFLQLGGALESNGQLDRAAKAYGSAVRLHPLSHAAYYALGVALGKAKKPAPAARARSAVPRGWEPTSAGRRAAQASARRSPPRLQPRA